MQFDPLRPDKIALGYYQSLAWVVYLATMGHNRIGQASPLKCLAETSPPSDIGFSMSATPRYQIVDLLSHTGNIDVHLANCIKSDGMHQVVLRLFKRNFSDEPQIVKALKDITVCIVS